MVALAAPLLVALLAGAAPAARPMTPSGMVSAFQTALDDTAKRVSGRDFAARENALKPIVTASYDTKLMARIAAGPYWDILSGAERDALTAALTDLTAASYASRIHPGLRYTVTEEKSAPQGRVLVRGQLQRRTGGPLKMSYLLEKSSAAPGWSIIDVWLNDTVSELALRRAEFAAVLRQKGAAGLIADLRSKIAALPKEDGSSPTQVN